MTARQVLERALARLEQPGAWTQGCYARNAANKEVLATDPSACKWCLEGAIDVTDYAEYAAENWEAYVKLRIVVGKEVVKFNDDPRTTQADAVRALKNAIATCEVER